MMPIWLQILLAFVCLFVAACSAVGVLLQCMIAKDIMALTESDTPSTVHLSDDPYSGIGVADMERLARDTARRMQKGGTP